MDILNFKYVPLIVYYLITFIWILEFVVIKRPKSDQDKGKSSFIMILTIIILNISVTVYFTKENLFSLKHPSILHYIAFFTYPLGVSLRYIPIYHLGNAFTRGVDTKIVKRLVSTGPYKYIQHPLYLGLLLLTISTPLFFNNWLMSMISFLTMFLALRHRMLSEEKLLYNEFKSDYLEWKKGKARLFPGIY
jgi:protein-S-isoprenylcysteine O-methyltransferase Ste14